MITRSALSVLQEPISFPEDFHENESGMQVNVISRPCLFSFTSALVLLPRVPVPADEGDQLAVESRPGAASDGGGAAEERSSSSAADGGVGAPRGAAAHHGQRQWEGLPHHGQPALLAEHLARHGLHLRHRHPQGRRAENTEQKCVNLDLMT